MIASACAGHDSPERRGAPVVESHNELVAAEKARSDSANSSNPPLARTDEIKPLAAAQAFKELEALVDDDASRETLRAFIAMHPEAVNASSPVGGAVIQWALDNEHENLALELLAAKADPCAASVDDVGPLSLAARGGLNTFIEAYYAGGFSCVEDSDWGSPLHLAADFNRRESARILLAHGASVNVHAPKDHGRTPLILAASDGHAEMIRLLVAAGAHLELTDDNGNTALHWAAFAARERSKREYSRSGKWVHSFPKRPPPPLALEALIELGANVNARNKRGETALHEAAICNAIRAIKLLLANGARKRTKDAQGKTARDLAREHGHEEAQELL